MLFFSGFGVQAGRESYMIPVDATIWKERDVRREGSSVESVLDAMKTRVAISRASDGEQVPSVSSSLLEDVRFGATENAAS